MILSNRNIKQTKTSQICFNRKDYTHLHKQWHHKHGEYSNRGSNNEFSWFTDYLLAKKAEYVSSSTKLCYYHLIIFGTSRLFEIIKLKFSVSWLQD